MREWVDEVAEASGAEMLVIDGFDDAIIGVTASMEPLVVYSERKIIEILIAEGASEEDAWDYYGFNIQGAYVGPGTPVIVQEPE